MFRLLLPFVLIVLVFSACSSVSHVKNESQIRLMANHSPMSLQFDTTHPFLFKKDKCEAIWDESSKSVFISGSLLKSDSEGMLDQLNILIEGVNLKEIEFPHELSLQGDENVTVAWYDEEEVSLERNLCIDDDCEFRGDLTNIKFVLTGFTNGVLSGYFDGRVFLKGIGKRNFTKTSAFKEICNASFRLNLIPEELTNNEYVASLNTKKSR